MISATLFAPPAPRRDRAARRRVGDPRLRCRRLGRQRLQHPRRPDTSPPCRTRHDGERAARRRPARADIPQPGLTQRGGERALVVDGWTLPNRDEEALFVDVVVALIADSGAVTTGTKPIFEGFDRTTLRLVDSKVLDGQVVLLNYQAAPTST